MEHHTKGHAPSQVVKADIWPPRLLLSCAPVLLTGVLRVKSIGVHDLFFQEPGSHTSNADAVLERLQKAARSTPLAGNVRASDESPLFLQHPQHFSIVISADYESRLCTATVISRRTIRCTASPPLHTHTADCRPSGSEKTQNVCFL